MERKINPRSFLASNNESLRFYSVYFDQVLISVLPEMNILKVVESSPLNVE